MGRLETRAETGQSTPPEERRLLALALGRRLEAAEHSLDQVEAALRHLGHCTAPEREQWLQRAQADIDDLRRIIGR